MANRKGIVGALGAFAALTVATIYQENIAGWLELNGGNTLFSGLAWSKGLATLGFVLTSPFLTHGYAAGLGIMAAVLVMNGLRRPSSNNDKIRVPEVTLSKLVAYLTDESQWGQERFRSNQAIAREMLDYLASRHLPVLARLRSPYGHDGPLSLVDRTYFNSVIVDVAALRQGREDAVQLSPDAFGDTLVDFRVWTSDVEAIWPRKTTIPPRP